MQVDWESSHGALLINPRMPKGHMDAAAKLPRDGEFADKLWLATSGSTSQLSQGLKFAALTKHSFLACAAAVNAHLQSDKNDVWLNPLPLFHVGGLAIYARSSLSHAAVKRYDQPWNPENFVAAANDCHATLSALVPTQIFDLVAAALPSPPTLRAIIVGGGRLSSELHRRASYLGWPLLPSYGLTEAASQVATALPVSQGEFTAKLKILDHITVSISSSQQIMLKGPSLLACYAFASSKGCEIVDPKKDEWLITEDLGEICDNFLHVHGRAGDFVKIGGENANLLVLEDFFQSLKTEIQFTQDSALIAMPDPRLGHVVHLVVAGEPSSQLEKLVTAFHEQIMPFEKIRRIHYCQKLPRSPLNKLLRAELLKQLEAIHLKEECGNRPILTQRRKGAKKYKEK